MYNPLYIGVCYVTVRCNYMHDEDIVCTCMSVSVRDIKTAIEAGANSFQEVQDATGAGTVCGACNDVLESVVDQLLRNR